MQSPTLFRQMAAEFLGTFVLLCFGLASVAQSVLSQSDSGNYLTVNLAWGLAVMVGVYIAGSVSGGHLNPAITLALAVHRRFDWKKVAPYISAQFLGGLAASALVFLTYREAINAFDGGTRQIVGEYATAGIWATYPRDFLSNFPGGLIDQIVGTGLLTLVVFSLSDSRNSFVAPILVPLVVGGAVILIGMTFGFNAGYAINPARDLAPRLFTAFAGWGMHVFRAGNYWWWVPVVGPMLGAILGGGLYDLLYTRPQSINQPLANLAEKQI